jgi:serine/threonine protein kinase
MRDIHDAYNFESRIGSGSFGTVYLATYKQASGISYDQFKAGAMHGEAKRYAIKSISKAKVADHVSMLKREIEILK